MYELDPRNPEGVISGSFKFKPEIDSAIEEFQDLNVFIRAPEIGWLYVPAHGLITVSGVEQFQPLPSEQHMMAGEVEAEFLAQLDKADFVYIVNPERYLGNMSIYELGYSRGLRKPIYASHPLDFSALGIHDPKMIDLLRTSIPIMSPAEAARDIRRRLAYDASNMPPVSQNPFSVNHPPRYESHQDLLLPPPVAHIAEGTIMRFGNRIILVADGRWEGDKLTIPGTRVRPGEHRAGALNRLIEEKVGAEPGDVAHFNTSFMIPKSGYKRSINPDTFVFDDHVVDLRRERLKPRPNIIPYWVPNAEVETLINNGQIEPNAATLLASYLETAA